FVGKWHLNGPGQTVGFPEEQGYRVNIGGHHKGSPPGGYFAPFKNPRMDDKEEDEYLTDRLGDEAERLISEFSRNPDSPFFLMLSFYSVHTPIQPKPELKARYAEKLAKGDLAESRWTRPDYASMVHSMDENVGKTLAALEDRGLVDDTIVIFFSDNGGLTWQTTNHPLRSGKGYYHEGGIRVPLIVRRPDGVAAGSTCDEPVISNDFFPTLLELAKLPPEPQNHLDGRTLTPLLEGGTEFDRDYLYWHYPHYHGAGETPVSAVRGRRYKFIRHYEDGSRELYDLKNDLKERENLVEALPEQAEALERRLDAWLAEHDAYLPTPRAE
ncbi:MAG: sulfatase-like hydrolase/transferase, partial [Planctomycetota bacterium]